MIFGCSLATFFDVVTLLVGFKEVNGVAASAGLRECEGDNDVVVHLSSIVVNFEILVDVGTYDFRITAFLLATFWTTRGGCGRDEAVTFAGSRRTGVVDADGHCTGVEILFQVSWVKKYNGRVDRVVIVVGGTILVVGEVVPGSLDIPSDFNGCRCTISLGVNNVTVVFTFRGCCRTTGLCLCFL
jgi:hypothetical protein